MKASTEDGALSINPSRMLAIFLFGIAVYLGINFCLYLNYAMQMATFPYELDSGEGLSLHRAIALSRGESIYTPITSPPYTVTNYPPVFDLFFALLIQFFGPKLLLGRLLSVGSALAAGISIYLIVWSQTKRNVASVIAGFLFLSSGWVTSWSVLCRVDTLAIMLSLAGMYFFLKSKGGERRISLYTSAILFIVALFTRQSAVAAPAACWGALMSHHWRGKVPFQVQNELGKNRSFFLGLRFLSGLIGGSSILLVLFMVLTKGEFWRHIVIYTAGDFSWSILIFWLKTFVRIHGIIVSFCIVYVINRTIKKDFSACILFWIIALIVSLTAGKTGSSINYFLEFWSSSCIITGLILGSLVESKIPAKRVILEYGIVICFVLQLFQLSNFRDWTMPSIEYEASGQTICQFVRDTSGEILSEYSGYLALNGRPIFFQPFSMSQLSRRGLWDQSSILENISEKKFDLIIMSKYGLQWGRWTQDMAKKIQSHYKLIRVERCFELHSYHHSTIDLGILVRRNNFSISR